LLSSENITFFCLGATFFFFLAFCWQTTIDVRLLFFFLVHSMNAKLTLVTLCAGSLLVAGCWKATTPSVETGAIAETGNTETGAVVATGSTDTGAVETGAAMVDRTVTLDSKASSLEWFGKKVVGSHTGTVVISSGSM
jgi:hypothetical protein